MGRNRRKPTCNGLHFPSYPTETHTLSAQILLSRHGDADLLVQEAIAAANVVALLQVHVRAFYAIIQTGRLTARQQNFSEGLGYFEQRKSYLCSCC